MSDSIDHLAELPMRIGTFRMRIGENEMSPTKYAGLLFTVPKAEGVPDFGDFVCHTTSKFQEVNNVRHALWICTHVDTGMQFSVTQYFTPFASITTLFALLGEKGESIKEQLDKVGTVEVAESEDTL